DPSSTRNVPLPNAVIIGAWFVRIPTSPSKAGAMTAVAWPSNSVASAEMTETVNTIGASILERFRFGDRFLDSAHHVERLLRQVIELTGHHALERLDCLLELHVLAFDAGELLGHGKRLREEALHAARTRDHALVVFRQLVHAQDRDDVLQLLVPLQNTQDLGRGVVMPITKILCRQDARARSERVHS